jgi:proteasome lid subunit RPN8/RPN11
LNKRKSNISDKSIVRVKPKAYYKMLVHVLRFGSKTRSYEQFKEVMGILIGYLEGEGEIKDVIIEDAVPVSHGGSIEVRFAPGDYAKFSAIDEQFAKKNWFSVGWYHSHPGLKIFFSGTDIINQLGWQTANPSAIGIVFDHTYLEEPNDPGFRTFRLDDPSKGDASHYHEVKTIIEPPNSLEFYRKIIELISRVQTKDPPILELNERLNIFGNVSVPNNEELIVNKPNINAEHLITNLQQRIFLAIESLIGPLTHFYNNWSNKLIEEIINLNLSMKENILLITNSMNDQMNDLQEIIKEDLREDLDILDFKINNKLELLDKNIEKSKELLDNFKNEIQEKLNDTLNNLYEESASEFNSLFDSGSENIQRINEINSKLTDLLETQNDKVEEIRLLLEQNNNKLLKENEAYQDELNDEFKNKISNLSAFF